MMFYTMNDESYSVAIFGDRAVIDATWFGYADGKVMDDKNRHVYTLYPDLRLELGVDYQSWYDEDQVPVSFLEWSRRKSNRNIKILSSTETSIRSRTHRVAGHIHRFT